MPSLMDPLYDNRTYKMVGPRQTPLAVLCAFSEYLLGPVNWTASSKTLYAQITRHLPNFSMSSSRSSVELLFTPPRLSDPDVLHSEALELPPDSPSRRASSSVLTSLTPLSKSPQYSERLLYVEVPTLSSEVKAQYATDLAERALSVAEFFPRSEMRSIIGEYQTDTQLFYFVKLSDDTAFRVSICKPASSFLVLMLLCSKVRGREIQGGKPRASRGVWCVNGSS